MVTPIRLNFTNPGGADVAGYTKVIPALYDSGAGYGYENSPLPTGYVRGINSSPKLDSGHTVGGADVSDFRIDVPVGSLVDVVVALGDPLLAQDASLIISDAGSNGRSLASAVGANSFQYVGHALVINSWLRLRLGKSQGAPNTTSVAYVLVLPAEEQFGTMRAIAPAGTRRLP